MAAGGERRGTVENSDVIETEKTTLKDVHAIGVFAIDPPGEVEKQLVKDLFEEAAVGHAANATLDLVNAPGGPSVYGRIHVAKSPFIGGQLPIGMHIPFAEKQDELLFRIVRIH